MYKRQITILLIVIFILLIPLIAMQFTTEVNWSLSDFIIGGILLFGTGVLCEFTFRKLKTSKYRLIIIAGILIVFLLIWAELAVGIFGTPFSGS